MNDKQQRGCPTFQSGVVRLGLLLYSCFFVKEGENVKIDSRSR